MPKFFESPKEQYVNHDTFKHKALHTLQHLWGKVRPFEVVDFGERVGEAEGEKGVVFYTATGYFKGEKLPPEPQPGTPMTPEQIAAQEEARQKQLLADSVKATDSAVNLATKLGIDLKLVKPAKENGNITYQDVQAYAKANKK